MSNIGYVKGVTRLGSWPLDDSTIFASLTEFQQYYAPESGVSTCYMGQLCAVLNSETGKYEAWVIDSPGSAQLVNTDAVNYIPEQYSQASYWGFKHQTGYSKPTCMLQHSGHLYIGLQDYEGNAAVCRWDGTDGYLAWPITALNAQGRPTQLVERAGQLYMMMDNGNTYRLNELTGDWEEFIARQLPPGSILVAWNNDLYALPSQGDMILWRISTQSLEIALLITIQGQHEWLATGAGVVGLDSGTSVLLIALSDNAQSPADRLIQIQAADLENSSDISVMTADLFNTEGGSIMFNHIVNCPSRNSFFISGRQSTKDGQPYYHDVIFEVGLTTGGVGGEYLFSFNKTFDYAYLSVIALADVDGTLYAAGQAFRGCSEQYNSIYQFVPYNEGVEAHWISVFNYDACDYTALGGLNGTPYLTESATWTGRVYGLLPAIPNSSVVSHFTAIDKEFGKVKDSVVNVENILAGPIPNAVGFIDQTILGANFVSPALTGDNKPATLVDAISKIDVGFTHIDTGLSPFFLMGA